jgi:hypothetical protein
VLQHALKEWAVICRALAEGKQSLVFRKGGVDDPDGEFRLERKQFWLYPTYVHQQRSGIKPEFHNLMKQAEEEKPPSGMIRISHFAEVTGIYHLHDMVGAMLLRPYHIYSDDTVHARFAYRFPGLHALVLRVCRSPQVFEIPELERYAGCRSWVDLDEALTNVEAAPVLADEDFKNFERELNHLLKPTALT